MSVYISNENVILVTFEQSQFQNVYDVYSNGRYSAATGVNRSFDESEFQSYLHCALNSSFFLTIHLKSTNEFIGLLKFSIKNNILLINLIIILPPYKRKGYAKQSISILLKYIKSNFLTNASIAFVDIKNTESIGFFNSLNYKKIKYLRRKHCYIYYKNLII